MRTMMTSSGSSSWYRAENDIVSSSSSATSDDLNEDCNLIDNVLNREDDEATAWMDTVSFLPSSVYHSLLENDNCNKHGGNSDPGPDPTNTNTWPARIIGTILSQEEGEHDHNTSNIVPSSKDSFSDALNASATSRYLLQLLNERLLTEHSTPNNTIKKKREVMCKENSNKEDDLDDNLCSPLPFFFPVKDDVRPHHMENQMPPQVLNGHSVSFVAQQRVLGSPPKPSSMLWQFQQKSDATMIMSMTVPSISLSLSIKKKDVGVSTGMMLSHVDHCHRQVDSACPFHRFPEGGRPQASRYPTRSHNKKMSTESYVDLQISFPSKLYKLLNKAEKHGFDDIISFSPDGRHIVIHNRIRFTQCVMNKWFKHRIFASFHRQLNSYGFVKLPGGEAEKLIFYHPNFRRGCEKESASIAYKKTQGEKGRQRAKGSLRKKKMARW